MNAHIPEYLIRKLLAASRTLRSIRSPCSYYWHRCGLSRGCSMLRLPGSKRRCFVLPCSSTGAGLLSCDSPTIPRLAGTGAFWQGKSFWLPYRCFADNTLFLPPFQAGCRITVMLWLCTSAWLPTRRELFVATYRLLPFRLLLLLYYRRFWLCERYCNNGFLVNSEPLQCDCLS